jgi:DNA-binding CsgD family transcriptional regulator
MTSRSSPALALALVEHAAGATDRDALMREVFATLAPEVGFDSASLTTPDGRGIFTWNKPEACTRAWLARAHHYLREGLPMFAAARGCHGVVHDLDVLTRDQRSRSSFYAEYVRPLGARSIALVVVRAGDTASHTVSFSRHAGKAFRERDLERLRKLRSALSLAVRVCPGPEQPRSDVKAQLTPREAEIAGYVAHGLQNAEIAALCGSSPFTVRNQLVAIFRKLEVTTRSELVARVLEADDG